MAEPLPIAEPEFQREPALEISPPRPSYDRQAWRQLLESDEDLARVASVLSDYGHQYVDELASEYLAAADKTRLPEIVDGIVGRAGVSSVPPGPTKPLSEVRPARRTNLMDRPPRPMPAAKPEVSGPLPDPAPQPPEPARQEVEPAKQETPGAPAPLPIAMEPGLMTEDRSNPIGRHDEFVAMLGRLSRGAATPGKNK